MSELVLGSEVESATFMDEFYEVFCDTARTIPPYMYQDFDEHELYDIVKSIAALQATNVLKSGIACPFEGMNDFDYGDFIACSDIQTFLSQPRRFDIATEALMETDSIMLSLSRYEGNEADKQGHIRRSLLYYIFDANQNEPREP